MGIFYHSADRFIMGYLQYSVGSFTVFESILAAYGLNQTSHLQTAYFTEPSDCSDLSLAPSVLRQYNKKIQPTGSGALNYMASLIFAGAVP